MLGSHDHYKPESIEEGLSNLLQIFDACSYNSFLKWIWRGKKIFRLIKKFSWVNSHFTCRWLILHQHFELKIIYDENSSCALSALSIVASCGCSGSLSLVLIIVWPSLCVSVTLVCLSVCQRLGCIWITEDGLSDLHQIFVLHVPKVLSFHKFYTFLMN